MDSFMKEKDLKATREIYVYEWRCHVVVIKLMF